MREFNVIPFSDTGHHIDGADCPCLPDIEYVDEFITDEYNIKADCVLIIHHSFDGREYKEQLLEMVKYQYN